MDPVRTWPGYRWGAAQPQNFSQGVKKACAGLLLWMVAANVIAADAPTYSASLNDPTNAYDAPVPGFVGPDGVGGARLDNGDGTFTNPDNYVNPLFFGWVQQVTVYAPAPGVASGWNDPSYALGHVTGDNWDIVSLGDLGTTAIGNGTASGRITLDFATPVRNLSGADFVVFENGFVSGGLAGIAGQITAELAYVEVSSNGSDFARFPSRSRTPAAVGAYGTIDPTNVFNLAGKHVNAGGQSWGTPFDLSQLASDPLVVGGQVDLNAIRYVQIVDIPGKGPFTDSQGNFINRFTDSQGNPIYDAWLTSGSGGFDLEAVGAISQNTTFPTWAAQNNLPVGSENQDSDGDGLVDLLEYAFARAPTVADNATPPTTFSISAGRLQITFPRDERAVDLIYEVQASDDLSTWTTIAKSQSGGAIAGANGFSPGTTETSAGPIASVGVIRQVDVRDLADLSTHPKRFMRVRIAKP